MSSQGIKVYPLAVPYVAWDIWESCFDASALKEIDKKDLSHRDPAAMALALGSNFQSLAHVNVSILVENLPHSARDLNLRVLGLGHLNLVSIFISDLIIYLTSRRLDTEARLLMNKIFECLECSEFKKVYSYSKENLDDGTYVLKIKSW